MTCSADRPSIHASRSALAPADVKESAERGAWWSMESR